MPAPVIQLKSLSKSFNQVPALKPFSLELNRGDILGLVGENGAGKSTLIKLISGVYQPSGGSILWNGKEVQFPTPSDALETGIATIHQELEFFAHLSVAENMLMGDEWPRKSLGRIDWNKLHQQAAKTLNDFGIQIPTDQLTGNLTPAEQQDVIIASALSRNAKLLILDEPTASLSEQEVKRLFEHIKRLQKQGVTIIYVSHRLDEIFELTNRIAILRDGELIADKKTSEMDVNQLIHDMVGKPLDQVYPRTRSGKTGEDVLELKQISRKEMFENISFKVRSHEIVGLAGLVGSGRSELARAIYGMYPIDSGKMLLINQSWSVKNPTQALKDGVVYIPEERKRQGLVLGHSLKESVSIGFTDMLTKLGMIQKKKEKEKVLSAIETYDIRANNINQEIGTLSGGNQQKALLARWLMRNPDLIILDEPTRGVDVGAKSQIHALIDQLAAEGKAILVISSDLQEILGLSDRILVMNRGKIDIELQNNEMTEHNIILASSGLYKSPH
jgi:ABC-type sugar transport system ATPase subunit